jgi:hypothetical protein
MAEPLLLNDYRASINTLVKSLKFFPVQSGYGGFPLLISTGFIGAGFLKVNLPTEFLAKLSPLLALYLLEMIADPVFCLSSSGSHMFI